MIEKSKLIDKLNDLSPRELDIFVAKHFYGLEVKIDRVASKNNNNIKYLYLPQKHKKYARHFSKSKTKTEKNNDKYRALPRWASDIRDCWKLLNDATTRFGEFQIKVLDSGMVSVVACSERFDGTPCASIVRMVLLLTFNKEE